jgi:hypothetical protein
VKLVALWLTALVAAAFVAGSCSVNHRSGDFACERTADCSDGRFCVDGVCVVTTVSDAGVKDGPGNPGACPEACTSCNPTDRTCKIDCSIPGSCQTQITCPKGWTCDVTCTAVMACNMGVDCTGSTACTITCGGRESCLGVRCGDGPCAITCTGRSSCEDVDCGTSCACDVDCGINASCFNLTCKSIDCELPPFEGCTSSGQGCNTCP